MGLSQQYIKDEISDEEFAKRCNRLKRIPINAYVSISEKFMQGEISEDEFVERYNRLVEQEAENTGNRSNHMSIYKRKEK